MRIFNKIIISLFKTNPRVRLFKIRLFLIIGIFCRLTKYSVTFSMRARGNISVIWNHMSSDRTTILWQYLSGENQNSQFKIKSSHCNIFGDGRTGGEDPVNRKTINRSHDHVRYSIFLWLFQVTLLYCSVVICIRYNIHNINYIYFNIII